MERQAWETGIDTGTERRQRPRTPMELVVFFWQAADGEGPDLPGGRTIDASREGMFIETPRPLPPRSLVRLEAFLDSSDEPPVRGWARVCWRRRWRHPRGMGVELVRVSPEDRGRLERWIDQVESAAAAAATARGAVAADSAGPDPLASALARVGF